MWGGRSTAIILLASAFAVAAAPPAPIATIQLDQLATECAGQKCETATLVFLSETQLAVSLQHFSPDQKGELHYLFVLDVGPGLMRVTAKREHFPTSAFVNGLQRTAAGKLVVVERFPNAEQFRIYDPDLEHFSGLPSGISLSPTGKIMNIFGPPPSISATESLQQIASPISRPIAISDESYLVGDTRSGTFRVIGFDAEQKGTFSFKKNCAFPYGFVDSKSLLIISDCHKSHQFEIVDLSGNVLRALDLPKGSLGVGNFRTSADCNRMVFNILTESVWAQVMAFKRFRDVSDGEKIRVLDTHTGGVCFSLDHPMNEDREGEMHASISPAGNRVAVLTASEISVYQLPDRPCPRSSAK